MSLPKWFCWTRFGTEAGQPIDEILDRKEQERVDNAGIFFWGIGNALGPSLRELLRRTRNPEVMFSPIRSAPRAKDANPVSVVAWTSAKTLDGEAYRFPVRSLVTSGHNPLTPKRMHYALVCFSDTPLVPLRPESKIALTQVRNLLTGHPVATLQTTAVVQRKATGLSPSSPYEITFRARLVYPYFLTLLQPVQLLSTDPYQNWSVVVRQAWHRRRINRISECVLRDHGAKL